MSRTTLIVILALAATFAGFALATNARRLTTDDSGGVETSVAAGPQTADLEWRETYGKPGEQLVFTVDELEVTEIGWNARIGVENDSSVGWELVPGAAPDGSFGLQLFETGDSEELDDRNSGQTLPAVRAASDYVPELPPLLEPGSSWEGEISARGALVANSFARVVFGTLIAVGKPPEEFEDTLIWITDHSYQLRA